MTSVPEDDGWFRRLLGLDAMPDEGSAVQARGQGFTMRDGILRADALLSAAQRQTATAFGYKWHQRDTFERPEALARVRAWLIERYGDVAQADWLAGDRPKLVLDAGCGGAMSAAELFGAALVGMRYVGVDVSEAVDVARDRFAGRAWPAGFLQADLMRLPFAPGSFDAILSEGVMHHTDSTEAAFRALVPLLRPSGRFLFYVYRRKGPIREFTDDHVRERIQAMTPAQAWEALKPLTQLGIALGRLGATIEIDRPIDLLGIPAGSFDLQRFFYWHVCKTFYRPELTFDEMHHINFDWFAPKNAHRQSEQDVRGWCDAAGLEIERERIEEAGITMIARKRG